MVGEGVGEGIVLCVELGAVGLVVGVVLGVLGVVLGVFGGVGGVVTFDGAAVTAGVGMGALAKIHTYILKISVQELEAMDNHKVNGHVFSVLYKQVFKLSVTE